MSTRSQIIPTLTVLFLLLVSFEAAHGSEPKYRGRALTSWLEQCADTPLMETQQLAEAQQAIRAIGAEKALPILLRLVKTKDDPFSTWIMEKAEKYQLQKLHWPSAIERQLQGIAGFEVLGTNCAGAVPELTKLLDDKELAFIAARCLANVGKPAEVALCQCLTNGDWHVRHLSVFDLASVTDDVEVYVNRIKPQLNDAEQAVRSATVECIAVQDQAPELAVPLLISALRDPDDHVCAQAAEGLSRFSTNALSAFSALTNVAATGTDQKRQAALNALSRLTPREALPILSNAVVSGSAQTMSAALRDLKSVDPDLALKMTLAELHSTDSGRRLAALSVARTYDAETPGIAEALKSAASSNNPEFARRAKMTMRQMVRNDDPKAVVQVPNEPSYQGKTLGQWLSMRHDGWQLSPDALQALQALGTNAIPALLARLTYKEPIFDLDDYNVSMGGTIGLIALREQAKPALPALTALMDGDNHDLALRAMVATLGMGSDAIPCLIKGLTNQSATVRSEAAHVLTEWRAKYPEEIKQAVPYMLNLLSDPEERVRMNATNELKELDPQAAAKAGIR